MMAKFMTGNQNHSIVGDGIMSGKSTEHCNMPATPILVSISIYRPIIPIPFNNAGTIEYTTDATTARALSKKGANLAIYNNNAALGSVTLGDNSSVAVLASGVTDASGNVGIPCKPNDWTYVSAGDRSWIKSSAATLLVYLIYDETSIKQEASR